MRRALVSAALLLALAAAVLAGSAALDRLTGQLTAEVERTAALALTEDWPAAREAADGILRAWDRQAFLLHTTLRHGDLREIGLTLERLRTCTGQMDAGQCAVAAAEAAALLDQLARSERLTLENIL